MGDKSAGTFGLDMRDGCPGLIGGIPGSVWADLVSPPWSNLPLSEPDALENPLDLGVLGHLWLLVAFGLMVEYQFSCCV